MDATQREKLASLFARENLAVIATQGEEWPTATMQAFAELPELDVIFIMAVESEKFQNLTKRPKVTVMIDSRHSGGAGNLQIERASIQGIASEIPRGSASWDSCKAIFLKKNPFEAPFFGGDSLRMVRIKLDGISYGGAGTDHFKVRL